MACGLDGSLAISSFDLFTFSSGKEEMQVVVELTGSVGMFVDVVFCFEALVCPDVMVKEKVPLCFLGYFSQEQIMCD